MDLIRLSNQLKTLQDNDLIKEMIQPSGAVPQYLVAAELQRRKGIRETALPKQQPSQSTVVDDLPGQYAGLGVAAAPRQEPVQKMADGGEVNPWDSPPTITDMWASQSGPWNWSVEWGVPTPKQYQPGGVDKIAKYPTMKVLEPKRPYGYRGSGFTDPRLIGEDPTARRVFGGFDYVPGAPERQDLASDVREDIVNANGAAGGNASAGVRYGAPGIPKLQPYPTFTYNDIRFERAPDFNRGSVRPFEDYTPEVARKYAESQEQMLPDRVGPLKERYLRMIEEGRIKPSERTNNLLMQIGTSMMAAKSPFFWTNVGEGGKAGLGAAKEMDEHNRQISKDAIKAEMDFAAAQEKRDEKIAGLSLEAYKNHENLKEKELQRNVTLHGIDTASVDRRNKSLVDQENLRRQYEQMGLMRAYYNNNNAIELYKAQDQAGYHSGLLAAHATKAAEDKLKTNFAARVNDVFRSLVASQDKDVLGGMQGKHKPKEQLYQEAIQRVTQAYAAQGVKLNPLEMGLPMPIDNGPDKIQYPGGAGLGSVNPASGNRVIGLY